MAKSYYAVKEGRKIGIYNTWNECEEQVKGYSGAKYKKFFSYEEALLFINGEAKEVQLEDNMEKSVAKEALDEESIKAKKQEAKTLHASSPRVLKNLFPLNSRRGRCNPPPAVYVILIIYFRTPISL